MELLGDVEPEWQTRQLRRARHAEDVGQGNGVNPLDIGFAGLGTGDVDTDARPRLAAVGDGELHVDGPVVEQQRLALSPEGEPLVRVSRQGLFQAVGEVSTRVAQDDVDVLGRPRAVAKSELECDSTFDEEPGEPALLLRSRTPAMIM